MKKSVVILIAVIYVIAIVLVSFLGLKIETFNETIYVDRVECINEELRTSDDGTLYIVVDYIEDEENPPAVQLLWRVYPDNASTKEVTFVYDQNNSVARVTAFGTVIFNRKGTITIYITSNDGTSKSVMVKVIAR